MLDNEIHLDFRVVIGDILCASLSHNTSFIVRLLLCLGRLFCRICKVIYNNVILKFTVAVCVSNLTVASAVDFCAFEGSLFTCRLHLRDFMMYG